MAQARVAMGKTVESQRGERTAPRKSEELLEARLLQPNAENFVPAVLMTINEQAPSQGIFVVMQTSQYKEAGPMLLRVYVWRVIVLDPTRNPAETRIPAKQI